MRRVRAQRPVHKQVEPVRSPSLSNRHLTSLHELTSAEIDFLLRLASQVKARPSDYKTALEGRSLVGIHERPTLHTRLTFELAMSQLGGRPLSLNSEEAGLGSSTAIKDVARNLSRWFSAIVVRVQSHQTVLELAQSATVPVINGLSDFEHPCQALTDYFTLLEAKSSLANTTLAWVGDGNNVAHSLIYGAARLGVRIRIATPPGYEPDRSVVADARREGGDIILTHDPAEAVANAAAVYTDVWTSTGMEHEAEERQEIFRSYQVNRALMSVAGPQAVFMHCQPAHRDEEVADDVMDSPCSLVYQQAENRLHMQKAIFLALLA